VTDQAVGVQHKSVTDFRAVYEAHVAFVWHLLRRLGVPERDVEDAAHDVFVIFHRRADAYDPSRPVRPWLGGIAARVAADRRKKASTRREVVGTEVEAIDSTPRADETAEKRERRAALHRAMAALDDDKRAVFVLLDIEGFTAPEAATALEIPLNTVYSRLRLARDELRTALKGGSK
jgi:RNA polymerase sigma-70 factor, ECF subfamily